MKLNMTKILNNDNDVNYDDNEAIVLAVAYYKYKTLTYENKNQIVYDIKSILKNSDGGL